MFRVASTCRASTPDIINESEIEMHHVLSDEQKAKQLGSDEHPAFTYRAQEKFCEPSKKVWGQEYANIATGSYMTPPSSLFRAMAGEGPYPVKAFFFLGNNPMMSYANMNPHHQSDDEPGSHRGP